MLPRHVVPVAGMDQEIEVLERSRCLMGLQAAELLQPVGPNRETLGPDRPAPEPALGAAFQGGQAGLRFLQCQARPFQLGGVRGWRRAGRAARRLHRRPHRRPVARRRCGPGQGFGCQDRRRRCQCQPAQMPQAQAAQREEQQAAEPGQPGGGVRDPETDGNERLFDGLGEFGRACRAAPRHQDGDGRAAGQESPAGPVVLGQVVGLNHVWRRHRALRHRLRRPLIPTMEAWI